MVLQAARSQPRDGSFERDSLHCGYVFAAGRICGRGMQFHFAEADNAIIIRVGKMGTILWAEGVTFPNAEQPKRNKLRPGLFQRLAPNGFEITFARFERAADDVPLLTHPNEHPSVTGVCYDVDVGDLRARRRFGAQLELRPRRPPRPQGLAKEFGVKVGEISGQLASQLA